MSTSNTGASTTEDQDQPNKTRTKKKTLGAGRKSSKNTSMVDIVSAAPTGTGYLETNPFQGQETSGTAGEELENASGAVNSNDAAPKDIQQAESTGSSLPSPQQPSEAPAVNEDDEDHAAAADTAYNTAATEPTAATRNDGGSGGKEAPKVSSWTVHAKNARAALLGVTKALDKVDARAQDVSEVLRTAGSSLPERDLVAIVYEVASRTGHPVSEIVQVAKLELPVNSQIS